MNLWIPITIGAALAQTVRFMLQKQLKSAQLSTAGATFARFLYSSPLVALIAVTYATKTGQGAPDIPPVFWTYALLGASTQIIGTACVIALFYIATLPLGSRLRKPKSCSARSSAFSSLVI